MKLEGWEHRSLTDLAQYINGYAFKPDDWEKEGLPIIRIEQLKNPDSICDYYSGKIPDFNIIDNGDLIFSWSASLFLRFWNDGRAALNQHLFKVEAYENTDKYFLKSFIEFYLPEITKASHGSTMQHITRKELDRFGALVPIDKKEQEKIAEVLSTIDRAIAQTEAIIAKQQRIKTGLMQDLLTKGIDENGNIRSETTHEFKDSAIGRIPFEWDVSTLEDQCIRVTDGTHQQVKTTDAGVPFFYVSCIREGVILWNRAAMIDLRTYEIISQGREPKQGAILYTVVGSYGYAALVETEEKFAFQRHIAYILPNQEKLNPNFLLEWMNSKKIKEYADKSALGNAQKTITLGELRKFPLLIPNKNEQIKIVQCLSKQNIAIDQYSMVLEKLKTKKTGLMQDLLTRISHQNP